MKCERNARFGYCFRVSSRFHNEVEAIPDACVLQVLKNGIYFTIDGSTFPRGGFVRSSDLRSLSSEFEACKAEYAKAQERLVASIIDVARTYVPRFHVFASLAAQLDVLLAFAEASATASIPYTRPRFLPSRPSGSTVSTNGTTSGSTNGSTNGSTIGSTNGSNGSINGSTVSTNGSSNGSTVSPNGSTVSTIDSSNAPAGSPTSSVSPVSPVSPLNCTLGGGC